MVRLSKIKFEVFFVLTLYFLWATYTAYEFRADFTEKTISLLLSLYIIMYGIFLFISKGFPKRILLITTYITLFTLYSWLINSNLRWILGDIVWLYGTFFSYIIFSTLREDEIVTFIKSIIFISFISSLVSYFHPVEYDYGRFEPPSYILLALGISLFYFHPNINSRLFGVLYCIFIMLVCLASQNKFHAAIVPIIYMFLLPYSVRNKSGGLSGIKLLLIIISFTILILSIYVSFSYLELENIRLLIFMKEIMSGNFKSFEIRFEESKAVINSIINSSIYPLNMIIGEGLGANFLCTDELKEILILKEGSVSETRCEDGKSSVIHFGILRIFHVFGIVGCTFYIYMVFKFFKLIHQNLLTKKTIKLFWANIIIINYLIIFLHSLFVVVEFRPDYYLLFGVALAIIGTLNEQNARNLQKK